MENEKQISNLLQNHSKKESQYHTSDSNEGENTNPVSNCDTDVFDMKMEGREMDIILDYESQIEQPWHTASECEYDISEIINDDISVNNYAMPVTSLMVHDIASSSNDRRDLSTPTDNFHCQICNKTYVTLKNLKKHMLLHKNIDKLKCEDCNKGFNMMSLLRKHQVLVHSSIKNFICDECGRGFKVNWRLKQHKERHRGIRKSKCEICDKYFTDNSVLKRHQLTHVKKFKSEEHTENLPNKEHLRKYLKDHAGTESFVCEKCHKSFLFKGDLKRHLITVHDNVKHFKCDFCEKSFKSCWYLNEHKRKHENSIMRFMCEICCKSFMWKSKLKKHLLTHAKKIGKYISAKGKQSQQLSVESVSVVNYLNSVILDKTDYTSESLPFVDVCIKEEPSKLNYRSNVQEQQEVNTAVENKNMHESSCSNIIDTSKFTFSVNTETSCFRDDTSTNEDKRETSELEFSVDSHKNRSERLSEVTNCCLQEEQIISEEGNGTVPTGYGKSVILEGHKEGQETTCTTESLPFVEVYVKEEQPELSYSNVASEENILIEDGNIHKNLSEMKHCTSKGSEIINVYSVNRDSNQDLIDKHQNRSLGALSDIYCSIVNEMKSASKADNFARKMQAEEDTTIYSCQECNKDYASKRTYKKHMLIHANKKTFKCEKCDKFYSFKSELERHEVLHNSIKSFKCNECNELFKQKSCLYQHMLSHEGIKNFVCNICDKGFTKKCHLTRHSLMHVGIKKFECGECPKCFFSKGDLNQHVLATHLGIKRFKCYLCDKKFGYSSTLRHHVITHKKV